MKKVSLVGLLILTFMLSNCSQQGATLSAPTPKQIITGNQNIVPSAEALTATAAAGNAQSQVDYRAIVLFCEGKAPVPSAMLTSNYAISVSQFSCQVYGYTNSNNQLIVPTTVPLGTAPVVVATPAAK
jgi:hypothetical protein